MSCFSKVKSIKVGSDFRRSQWCSYVIIKAEREEKHGNWSEQLRCCLLCREARVIFHMNSQQHSRDWVEMN